MLIAAGCDRGVADSPVENRLTEVVGVGYVDGVGGLVDSDMAQLRRGGWLHHVCRACPAGLHQPLAQGHGSALQLW